MSDLKRRKATTPKPETFVIDGAYFRAQFGEALRTFVAPLNGVYIAARGADKATRKKRA